MALTNFTGNMDIIAGLQDEPNVDDGLSSAQLKAKFDEGGNKLKAWINGTLIPYLTGMNVDTANLKPEAVTRDKIEDGAVTAPKIADGNVTRAKLALYAVGGDNLEERAVSTGKLADGAVTHAKLGTFSVDTGNIEDGAVTEAKLSDGLLRGLPYLATFGSTTAAELDAAWSAGRMPVCVYAGNGVTEVAAMSGKGSGVYAFARPTAVGSVQYTLFTATGRWERSNIRWPQGSGGLSDA